MAMSNAGARRISVKIHADRSLDNSDMIQYINDGSQCAVPWEHRVIITPWTRKSGLRLFGQYHGTSGPNHNQDDCCRLHSGHSIQDTELRGWVESARSASCFCRSAYIQDIHRLTANVVVGWHPELGHTSDIHRPFPVPSHGVVFAFLALC
jgi:hypothetical protein